MDALGPFGQLGVSKEDLPVDYGDVWLPRTPPPRLDRRGFHVRASFIDMYSGEVFRPRFRKNYVTPDRQDEFLRFLSRNGLNVTAACRATGLAGTAGVYLQRKHDDGFRRRWEDVVDQVLDDLEEHQWQAAESNPTDRRWVLNRRRPERWVKPIEEEIKSEVTSLSDEELKRIVQG
ncbi:MAG: hypothetical protein CME04_10775 [Gemmatimonadaceae bacterium]|jgi:hypothetical protein|nr:hypothetical protein [Gemmatimonadaceae bacterium]